MFKSFNSFSILYSFSYGFNLLVTFSESYLHLFVASVVDHLSTASVESAMAARLAAACVASGEVRAKVRVIAAFQVAGGRCCSNSMLMNVEIAAITNCVTAAIRVSELWASVAGSGCSTSVVSAAVAIIGAAASYS